MALVTDVNAKFLVCSISLVAAFEAIAVKSVRLRERREPEAEVKITPKAAIRNMDIVISIREKAGRILRQFPPEADHPLDGDSLIDG